MSSNNLSVDEVKDRINQKAVNQYSQIMGAYVVSAASKRFLNIDIEDAKGIKQTDPVKTMELVLVIQGVAAHLMATVVLQMKISKTPIDYELDKKRLLEAFEKACSQLADSEFESRKEEIANALENMKKEDKSGR